MKGKNSMQKNVYRRNLITFAIILLLLSVVIIVLLGFFLPYKGGDDFSKLIITVTSTSIP
jgi:ABC-type sulfate transport system permease component